ncbi:MAG: sulfocyanin-like copper-binding protein [Longimicrobiales bacterium]|nr:sulfocyanin-like copper-binding protein [Longimicrobiales bacterium]
MKRLAWALSLNMILVACGGGDAGSEAEQTPAAETPAAAPAAPASEAMGPTGPLTVPEWYGYDEASNTVDLTIVAGETPDNNYWNYNGYINGAIDITVPEGATVTIEFTNDDPVMAHSIGVSSELENFAAPPPVEPVFEGAVTSNPVSMTEGGMPGSTETISFVASEAGEYTLVCYVPGHTAVGMWIYFTVSAEGEAGVQGL